MQWAARGSYWSGHNYNFKNTLEFMDRKSFKGYGSIRLARNTTLVGTDKWCQRACFHAVWFYCSLWQNASLPELINKYQDLALQPVRGTLPVRSIPHSQSFTSTTCCSQDGFCANKTTVHLLGDYAFAKRVWRGIQATLLRITLSSCVTDDSLIYRMFPGMPAGTNINYCQKVARVT